MLKQFSKTLLVSLLTVGLMLQPTSIKAADLAQYSLVGLMDVKKALLDCLHAGFNREELLPRLTIIENLIQRRWVEKKYAFERQCSKMSTANLENMLRTLQLEDIKLRRANPPRWIGPNVQLVCPENENIVIIKEVLARRRAK